MNCPELTSMTKDAGGSVDTALSRHLQECAACRRDLEIAETVRALLYPDTQVPARLNERVMARVRAQTARLMVRARPLDLFLSAILFGTGAYAAFMATGGGGLFAPSLPAVVLGTISAVVGAWYHRWQSARERARGDQRPLSGSSDVSLLAG